jgi:hypothetical protein
VSLNFTYRYVEIDPCEATAGPPNKRPVGKRGAVEKTVHSELAFFDCSVFSLHRDARSRRQP